ncbi:MAG: 4-oxalmesaconate hydratase [candidate division WS6 bacterium OLB20]|uniref:4-oxalmesaconate hydratase n=1 Tax=candidate division WS6 bacterium OLB20 TaxID=1617426 RepID=A0A136LY36_9BACT|nr:MAG: 4-oxalmesaconate hydratase [candidate division WS6 bacterium OLB20]
MDKITPLRYSTATMNKSILAVTAHADDHVVFAGTIFKLLARGYEYNEAILTDSGEGVDQRSAGKADRAGTAAMRSSEFDEASAFIGTAQTFSLGQEDQNLQYSKELMHELVGIIRKVRPEIALTMNLTDVHPDHQAAAHLAKEAFRWAAKSFRPELGEPHRTNIVLFCEGTLPVMPHVLVDITDTYQKKEDLFRIYASQAAQRDIDLLKGTAAVRGYHLRKKEGLYAEAFTTEQNILPILFE